MNNEELVEILRRARDARDEKEILCATCALPSSEHTVKTPLGFGPVYEPRCLCFVRATDFCKN